MVTKADIIAQLQKEILPLQGYKPVLQNALIDAAIGPVKYAFPENRFPIGAVHEFITNGAEDMAATGGFIAVLLSSLMNKKGICIWIGPSRNIFPPAIKSFGLSPGQIIFIDLFKEKEICWAMEEALTCEGLAAVIAQVPTLSFTASRRLQLAVEKSRVTGFVIRQNPQQAQTTACMTRWMISSILSKPEAGMPGVGFPCWHVELIKVRNGRPGSWEIECRAGKFRHLHKTISIQTQKKKTG